MRYLIVFFVGFGFGWLAYGVREAGRRWDKAEKRIFGEVYDQDEEEK